MYKRKSIQFGMPRQIGSHEIQLRAPSNWTVGDWDSNTYIVQPSVNSIRAVSASQFIRLIFLNYLRLNHTNIRPLFETVSVLTIPAFS